MIQFNLLPDVKLEYIKARRMKYLVMLSSLVITGVMIALVVSLFLGVKVVQRKHLNNLDKDIKRVSDQLKSEKDIDKILTVQNQLGSLNGLHDSKPAAYRIGSYLEKITPVQVSISELTIDFSAKTMKFTGSAGSIAEVNQFVDTLKFTEFQVDGGDSSNAFSTVVLSEFSRSDSNNTNDKKKVSYSITMAFDPLIFDLQKNVVLKVPDRISTRSITERPEPLFQKQPEVNKEKGTQ